MASKRQSSIPHSKESRHVSVFHCPLKAMHDTALVDSYSQTLKNNVKRLCTKTKKYHNTETSLFYPFWLTIVSRCSKLSLDD